ncbi:unnamed protein product [Closterium sp. Yama58-4]|nr:unnamed protein product [Closterium sp. Yama58-4]
MCYSTPSSYSHPAMGDETVSRLFRVRRTIFEMLHDRGYLVADRELRATKDDFRDQFGDDPQRDDLTLLKQKRDNPSDEIYVFFPVETKVGIKTLKGYYEKMKGSGVSRAVMVVQQNLTPFSKKILADMAPKYIIEVFQEGELLVNVTKHELVPQHVVLTDEEKHILLERYTVKEHQLPRMQRSDPVARRRAARVGSDTMPASAPYSPPPVASSPLPKRATDTFEPLKAPRGGSAWGTLLAALAVVVLLACAPLSWRLSTKPWRPHLFPPVCRPPTHVHAQADQLPRLFMFIGTEGSGHDLFEYIFSYLPVNISIDRFNPDLHLTSSPGQKVASALDPTGATVDCPKLPYSRHVYDFGVRMSTALKSKLQDTNYYLRARDPFPMGRIRTPLARPDLISLATFHGILYNLKLMVLVRNLTDTVLWSVLRRFHNDDVGLQARLIEDSMVYVDASFRTLPCGTFSLIDVDALVKRPKTASTALAQFLGLPGVAKEEVFSAIQRGKEKWEPTLTVQSGLGATADGDEAAEVTFDGQALEVFFQQRVGLWPLLDAAKGKPVFVPLVCFSFLRNFLSDDAVQLMVLSRRRRFAANGAGLAAEGPLGIPVGVLIGFVALVACIIATGYYATSRANQEASEAKAKLAEMEKRWAERGGLSQAQGGEAEPPPGRLGTMQAGGMSQMKMDAGSFSRCLHQFTELCTLEFTELCTLEFTELCTLEFPRLPLNMGMGMVVEVMMIKMMLMLISMTMSTTMSMSMSMSMSMRIRRIYHDHDHDHDHDDEDADRDDHEGTDEGKHDNDHDGHSDNHGDDHSDEHSDNSKRKFSKHGEEDDEKDEKDNEDKEDEHGKDKHGDSEEDDEDDKHDKHDKDEKDDDEEEKDDNAEHEKGVEAGMGD